MLDENGSQLKEGDGKDARQFNIRLLYQARWGQKYIAQGLGVSIWQVNKVIREQKMAKAA
jgi:DNA-binding transcriptional regulator LsrR (DeoR family)